MSCCWVEVGQIISLAVRAKPREALASERSTPSVPHAKIPSTSIYGVLCIRLAMTIVMVVNKLLRSNDTLILFLARLSVSNLEVDGRYILSRAQV